MEVVAMKRKALWLVVVFAALAACSQKSLEDNVNIAAGPAPDVDFSQYRTWKFGRDSYPATGIEHMDSPQFRTQAAKHFTDEMTKLGYASVAENPDFVMLLHVASEQQFDEQKMDDIYQGYDMAWAQVGKDDVWNEGTLIIFAADAKTGRQLWSSTAQGKLQDYVGFDDRLSRFNQVVSMMLAQFPKRL
jgi:hypothetical protein